MEDNLKKKINKYLSYQFIIYLIFFGLTLILVKKEFPIVIAISSIIVGGYVYFIHRLFHYIPENYNLHLLIHHKLEPSFVNFLIELILNILFFVSLYLICIFLNFKFINPIIIFYSGFIYTTTHMINYSLLHLNRCHRLHHTLINDKNLDTKNYGPDVFDHIFKTNYDNYFENNAHVLINIIVGFFITAAFFKIKIFE